MGSGRFFPTNPDLADILGRTDFDFENLFLIFLGSQLGPGLGPSFRIPDGNALRILFWLPFLSFSRGQEDSTNDPEPYSSLQF